MIFTDRRRSMPFPDGRGRQNAIIRKLLMRLNFTILMMILMLLQVSAVSKAQVSVNGSGMPLLEVIKSLKKQTGYDFFYSDQSVKKARPVTVNLKNVSLELALKTCLDAQYLTFKIDERTVIIKEKSVNLLDKAVEYIQNLKITGKVNDEKGMPIPGVTVKVKGTNTSVITDKMGSFRMDVTHPNSVLVFSYIGYENLELELKNRTSLVITLKESPTKLDDVVIIGYGQVRRGDLTGAVATVDIKSFEKAPVATFDQALAGRIAGVQVSGNDGQPGSINNIVIRGNNSITQSNSPLYVIDGFPIESIDESPVSPSDIESIQVLKDASSTSIYGSRGANGVIIITTKQGMKGAPVISLNSYYGLQHVAKKLDMLSPYEFVKYQNELNPTTTDKLYLDGRTLEDYRSVNGINMQDELYRTAPILNNDIAIRGGSQGTQYSVFANILGSDGVILNSGYKRTQGRFSLSQQIKKNLKANINATYTKSTTTGSIISDPTAGIPSLSTIYSALGYRPVSGIADVDLLEEQFDPAVISETPTDYRVNPIISLKNEINERSLSNVIINGTLDFKIINNLDLKIRGGYIGNNFGTKTFYNSKTQIGSPFYPTTKGTTGGIYNRKIDNWLNENTLTYNTKINKSRINAMVGFTIQENTNFYSGYTASYIEDESLGIDGLDLSTSIVPESMTKKWSLASFLARLNYDYNDKYLFTFSFRADGSSKFRKNNVWGYFPSGAFAWKMKQEDFMKNLSFVSDAKLRVSYGTTGNNRVDEYATYSGITYPYVNYYSFNNGNPERGAALTSTGNLDLKWETTAQFNIGYDLGFFKQKLRLVADYYSKKTTDLLLNAQLPHTTGYLTSYQNIGNVKNEGFEFSLQYDAIKTKNFEWATSFNISFNKNKVLKLQDDQSYRLSTVSFVGDFSGIAPYYAEVGKPMGMFYGAEFDGLYQYPDFNLANGIYTLKDEIPTNGRTRNSIQPGDMKFKDLNNDGTINTSDYTIIGNGNPVHIGGFMNDFRYKNFDLSVFLQWSYGNDIINANRLYFEQNTYNYYNFNQYATVVNRWSPDNQNTSIPRTGGVPPRIYHSNIIEDGSFLRLKTVSLGYTFSKELLKSIKLKTAKVYVSAQNLYTWTNYTGSDPEVSVRNSALTPGFDWSAYPRARTITFGLNVSL
ncbi:MAG: TonB-dependent receptor [Pedobacter sp.]|uniref:TonB-dependent receptor n=1 Tax=Pedobacter sp. TaxID=1411316 RepID=UPI00356165A1